MNIEENRLSGTESFDQSPFAIRFGWGREGVASLAPVCELVVIVDILSFTTAVEVAVTRGASVLPFEWRDSSAATFAAAAGAQLAGDRSSGGPSLSPSSLATLAPGDRIVLPSPNGATCARRVAESSAMVVAGCLRNARGVAELAVRHQRAAVIAAGEKWPSGGLRFAFEDLVGSGAILSHMDQAAMSPEARAAVGAFQNVSEDLLTCLLECDSGRELAGMGFTEDVSIASELDVSEIVPILRNDAFPTS